jgi:hypothetical protein
MGMENPHPSDGGISGIGELNTTRWLSNVVQVCKMATVLDRSLAGE